MRSIFLVALALAQALALTPDHTPQHITVTTSASSATVVKGSTVTLWADVTPRPNIHVYATNREGLTPVGLVVTRRPGISLGKVKFPPAEISLSAGATQPVPVYRKPFRLSEPVTIGSSVKAGETLTLAGVINYQACDDQLCYPAASLPVTWTLTVK